MRVIQTERCQLHNRTSMQHQSDHSTVRQHEWEFKLSNVNRMKRCPTSRSSANRAVSIISLRGISYLLVISSPYHCDRCWGAISSTLHFPHTRRCISSSFSHNIHNVHRTRRVSTYTRISNILWYQKNALVRGSTDPDQFSIGRIDVIAAKSTFQLQCRKQRQSTEVYNRGVFLPRRGEVQEQITKAAARKLPASMIHARLSDWRATQQCFWKPKSWIYSCLYKEHFISTIL